VVQSCHGLAEFAARHGPEFKDWELQSNYLCCLETSKLKMNIMISKLDDLRIKYTVFEEPDIGNEITSITIQAIPEDLHKKLFKNLNLTLS
jgi:hypothetical protein